MAFSPKLDSSTDQRLRELLALGDLNQRALILPLMGESWWRRQAAPIISSPLARPQSKPLGAVAGLATAALSEAKPQAPLPGPALPAAGQESDRLPGAGSFPTFWTLPAAGAPAAARAKDDAGGAPPLTTTPAEAASDWVVPLGFADAAPPAPAVPSPSGGPGPDPRPRILVRWSSDATDQDRSEALARVGGIRLDLIHTALMKAQGDGALEVIQADEATSLEAMLQAYGQTAKVLYAEVDQSLRSQVVSNDASYLSGSLWGMYGSDALIPIGPTGTTNVFGSQAETAWDRGFTGDKSVFVGIIDTGIDVSHPDLKDNIWTNPFDPIDGIDNDRNGYIDDSRGWDFFNNDNSVYDGSSDSHGTHVAGTIGATGRNAIGVAGVSWNVSMISAKFLGSSGGYVSGAIKALDYLTDLKLRHNLNIMATNNSWGGGAYSQALHEAIIRAARQNILFIAAAGNSARNNDLTPAFPANYSTLVGTPSLAAASQETVISVAAITNTGSLSSFSNYGLTTVDLGAPGSGILSTVPGGGYASYNGTSMATPHVTGAAALYAASNPGASAGQIRTALLASATPTPSLAGRTVTGGRLNVASLLESGASTWLSIYASQSALPEGQSGSTSFQFQVGRAGNTSTTHTVSWKVAGTGPAPATEADFAGQSTLTGVLTFDPGQTLKTLNIDVAGDAEVEFAEGFTVTIFDASGGAVISTARASSSISNDDLPTTTAVITNITDDVGLLQGPVSPGASTNDPTPSLSGSLSAALASGESLLIYNGSSSLGTANVSGLSWAFTPSLPATGGTSYSFTARVASAFGPLGPLSPARSLVLDTSAPTITASIDAVADNVGAIQGPVAAGASSDDSTPTLSGRLAAALVGGDTLRVFNGSLLLGTASVNNTTRSWSYTPNPGLPAGSYNFSVAVADAAGNLAPASNTWAYSLDTSLPTTTAVITSITDDVGLLQGLVSPGASTNDPTPSLSGSLSAALASGESLLIYNGSSLLGAASVTGLSWGFTPSLPATGGTSYSFTARVASSIGALAPLSAARSLVLDTSAPTITASIDVVADNVGVIQGPVAAGASSDDSTPTLSGSLAAALAGGDTLRVFNGSVLLGSASVNNTTRSWSYTPNPGLPAGSHNFSVAVADAAGNLAPASNAWAYSLDTSAPSLTISSGASVLKAGDTTTITFSFSEDPGTSFSWNGVAGDVTLTGGSLSAIAGSGLTRTATFTPTANSVGTATVTVATGTYNDPAGNAGGAASSAPLAYDTLPPSIGAAITSVSDDVGLWQGLVVEGGSSDDATPTLAGTLTAALASGDSLRVFNGAASVGAASVNNSAKTWTFTPSTGLADGTYAFRVAVADAFGNLGPLSTVRSLTVDTLAPSLAISSDKTALQAGATALISFTFSEDPGDSFAWDGSQGDLIISGGSLSALSSSNGLIRSATFTPTANSQGSAVIAVLAGSYNDASGNLGAASSLANLTFDTHLPSTGAILS